MNAMMPGQSPPVRGKPQPDIYTLLLIIAIIFLAVTVGMVMHNLMTTYGLTFTEMFTGRETSPI